jgi:hypothetical protein
MYCSANQLTPIVSFTVIPNIHHRVHNPPLDFTLSQLRSVHILTICLPKMHFNITLQCTPKSHKLPLALSFPIKVLHAFLIYSVCAILYAHLIFLILSL